MSIGDLLSEYEVVCSYVYIILTCFLCSLAVVEDDPTTGRYFIGRGCYPNSEGVVQLDAALMRGRDCAFGAVAALEG